MPRPARLRARCTHTHTHTHKHTHTNTHTRARTCRNRQTHVMLVPQMLLHFTFRTSSENLFWCTNSNFEARKGSTNWLDWDWLPFCFYAVFILFIAGSILPRLCSIERLNWWNECNEGRRKVLRCWRTFVNCREALLLACLTLNEMQGVPPLSASLSPPPPSTACHKQFVTCHSHALCRAQTNQSLWAILAKLDSIFSCEGLI